MKISPFSYLLPALTKQEDFLLPLAGEADNSFFLRALEFARFALGSTHPNPSVGAVIVKDGVIIAEGYTQPAGGKHAEVNAIAHARQDVRNATLYVTLEPCCHYGRTPPCTEAIIKSGIKRVVYGVADPNPRVFLEGIKCLIDAGLEVTAINHPELMELAQAHIMPFTVWIKEKRPYVIAKVATSKDNKIASQPSMRTKITGLKADMVVHQLRRAMDAVMVGARTARIDNPMLSARLGEVHHSKQPARIVVSSDMNVDEKLNIFNTQTASTIILTDKVHHEKYIKPGVHILGCRMVNKQIDLRHGFQKLAASGYTSILVEAGQKLFKSIISAKLADEIWWFTAPHELGSQGLDLDVKASELESLGFSEQSRHQLDSDELVMYSTN